MKKNEVEIRHSFWLPVLTMGLMGAFYWAIRGTGGFGGATGGAFAGLGWGLCWYYYCTGGPGTHRYGNAWTVLALTMGMAVGGLTGYGVFISWLNGHFNLAYPKEFLPIWAGWGYVALFVCGLHWGGIAGAFLAWTGAEKILGPKAWAARIACGVAGAALAYGLVRVWPGLVLPYWGEACYSDPAYLKDISRCIGTVRTIAWHLGLFLGFLAFEMLRKDWGNVKLMLIFALGFALPFTLGGYFQTLHGSALRLDWWKNWEMSIGLGGGMAIGLAFYCFNRPQAPEGRWSCLFPNTERLLGYAFPIWLTANIVVAGSYRGVLEHWGIQAPSTLSTLLALLALASSSAVFLWVMLQTKGQPLSRGVLTVPPCWKRRIFWMMQGLLVFAGLLVSVHPFTSMGLANYFLLGIYSLYIAGALAACFFLSPSASTPTQQENES